MASGGDSGTTNVGGAFVTSKDIRDASKMKNPEQFANEKGDFENKNQQTFNQMFGNVGMRKPGEKPVIPDPFGEKETETTTEKKPKKKIETKSTDKVIDNVKKLRPKKKKVIVKEPETQTKTEPQTQTAVGGGGRRGGPRVTTSGGAFSGKEPSLVSKIAKFSKENPATALLSLDALRRFMPSSSPFGVSGGRVGRRSAPS
tara:strand:- start:3 stop:605 length:603 start_codon:yes stop_codon:yes gene_type:complete